MTYDEFYDTADDHINEVVAFEVLFKATGYVMRMERVNYDGKRGWVKEQDPEGLTKVINAEWTGRIHEPLTLFTR